MGQNDDTNTGNIENNISDSQYIRTYKRSNDGPKRYKRYKRYKRCTVYARLQYTPNNNVEAIDRNISQDIKTMYLIQKQFPMVKISIPLINTWAKTMIQIQEISKMTYPIHPIHPI